MRTADVGQRCHCVIREIFAANLRKCRLRQGLSQEELAHRAKIDRTYVSALERGVHAASIDVVDRLAVALNSQAWELLRPEDST